MALAMDKKDIQRYLRNFAFQDLFIQELGWDELADKSFTVQVKEQTYRLRSIVQKRGFKVFQCDPDAQGHVPDDSRLRQIACEVKSLSHENIIIYTDTAQELQAWQWIRYDNGKATAQRINRLHKGQSGDLLAGKLMGILIPLEEEEQITQAEVSRRVRQAFDVEKVTKKFYDRFKIEHDKFEKLIDGITAQGDREWYTSIMLNRLMFIYFIQYQGFINVTSEDKLDGDKNYLRNRLKMTKEQRGPDTFHSFYRYFLLKLFHDGLSKRERTPELERLLGKVPYLNGGLFDEHQLEQKNPEIQIPDGAFEKIFDFFDEFDWHLDDRPNKSGNEINPDVLGYIFEKYINQKQMGAYYTKEDITEYISKNTILPYLFDTAQEQCEVAFTADGPVWSLLRDNPDEYIYEAVARGTQLALPPEIEAGVHDVSLRSEWNRPAAEEYALPTETWREVVARRNRHEEVRSKLVNGEITSINDLITYNLNIRKFAQDAIDYCEGTNLLRAFYEHIVAVTVLDPTCGSGAFLFAALNILEPLYKACLERMRTKVQEREQLNQQLPVQQRRLDSDIRYFKAILEDVDKHYNQDYFILKTIIIKNLYGVDIMEEATEICKLRLFLKLVSQVTHYKEIEPLPDIDFNIRAGNTLVGFATFEELRTALRNRLDFDNILDHIEQKAKDIEREFDNFRRLQTEDNLQWDIADSKQSLRKQLEPLRDEIDGYLAREYGIDPLSVIQKGSYEERLTEWRKSHQPFNWFVEFYKILKDGGFHVIIGNPPYVECSKVTKSYQLKDFITLSCGNLYALVMERCIQFTRQTGRNGMIVQLPITCTDRMIPLQNLLSRQSSALWLSNFDDRPAKLFDGLEHIRATIAISKIAQAKRAILSTKYNRWYTSSRETLFQYLQFKDSSTWKYSGAFPKMDIEMGESILQKIQIYRPLALSLSGKNEIYFHNAPQYWIRAMTFKPYFWNQKEGIKLSTQVKTLTFSTKIDANVVAGVLNSTLFYWWFILLSDCRHLNIREIEHFPIGLPSLTEENKIKLSTLCQSLMEDYQKHAVRKTAQYKATGKVIYDEFYPRHSKHIIDEIDRVLAWHYGFTDEELDFIINYDIKYRMGRGDTGEEEDE